MRTLDNKVVVVTGAGSGIGRALALDMAGRGALVAVSASNLLTFLGHFTAYTFISLLLLTSVVNALIAFVTERSADSRVLPSRVLAELADADPYTQLLGEEDEHITVGTAVAVLSNWTGKPEDRRGMIDALCRALLDVLATYSESISALFHDAPLRDEWRETFTVFADDLRLAAQRMAA